MSGIEENRHSYQITYDYVDGSKTSKNWFIPMDCYFIIHVNYAFTLFFPDCVYSNIFIVFYKEYFSQIPTLTIYVSWNACKVSLEHKVKVSAANCPVPCTSSYDTESWVNEWSNVSTLANRAYVLLFNVTVTLVTIVIKIWLAVKSYDNYYCNNTYVLLFNAAVKLTTVAAMLVCCCSKFVSHYCNNAYVFLFKVCQSLLQ